MRFDPSQAILISIKPKFASEILYRRKKWEYRRRPPKTKFRTRMLIYASGDTQAIVGDCTMAGVMQKPVNEVIDMTGLHPSIERKSLEEYFKGYNIGAALKIENPHRYKKVIPLSELRRRIPGFMPPENFIYLKEKDKKLGFLFKLAMPNRRTLKK